MARRPAARPAMRVTNSLATRPLTPSHGGGECAHTSRDVPKSPARDRACTVALTKQFSSPVALSRRGPDAATPEDASEGNDATSGGSTGWPGAASTMDAASAAARSASNAASLSRGVGGGGARRGARCDIGREWGDGRQESDSDGAALATPRAAGSGRGERGGEERAIGCAEDRHKPHPHLPPGATQALLFIFLDVRVC